MSLSAAAQTAVTTYHNDLARTGQNTSETILTPATVSSGAFGRRFTQTVDGYVYAQPLYLPGVTITTGPNAGVHNVVFVATEHDSVYAFDADTNTGPNGGLLWKTSFAPQGTAVTPVPSTDTSDFYNPGGWCGDLVPEIGITSTPVIDPAAGILYVLARTKEGPSTWVQRLHALNVATGADAHAPQVVSGSYPGTGDGGTTITFDPLFEAQRSGLVLSNGVVYAAWASHCDASPTTNDPSSHAWYHGWVMGFDAQSLQIVSSFVTTPEADPTNAPASGGSGPPQGGEGGIWAAGGAPAVDQDGALYFLTGNGIFDANSSTAPNTNYGDSFMKLSTVSSGQPKLAVADYFTPGDEESLETFDNDFGSGSPMLLPDQTTGPTHLAVACGKEGTIFLVNRDGMGGFNATTDQVVQSLPEVIPGGTWSAPAYWNGHVYYIAAGDSIKDFQLSGGLLSTSPVTSQESYDYPGATPSVSANGTSDGILWVVDIGQWSSGNPGPAILRAYDASDISQHFLYSSAVNPNDQAPPATKFTVPTIADGKVFVVGQGQLAVYGGPVAQLDQATTSVSAGTSATITVELSAPPAVQVSVSYATSPGSVNPGQPGVNYSAVSGTLTFSPGTAGPGVTTNTFQIDTFQPVPSPTAPYTTVNITLSDPLGGLALRSPSTEVLTITNPATSASRIAFLGGATVTEGGTATFTVERGLPRTGTATVQYQSFDGSAKHDTDYQASTGMLTFLPNVASKTFAVKTFLNDEAAPPIVALMQLSNVTGAASLGAPDSALLTINDSVGKIQFVPSSYTLNPATSGGTVTLKVTRLGGVAAPLTVAYTTQDGTALSGSDYTLTSGTLTFAETGLGATTQTIQVPIAPDTTGQKWFNVVLSSPSGGAVLGTASTALVTIDGAEPTFAFGSGKYNVLTTQTSVLITVKRSPPLTGMFIVHYTTSPDTATSPTDYTSEAGNLTFTAGIQSKFFSVPIAKDTVVKEPRTFDLALSNPSAGSVIDAQLGTATVTITDPNLTPTVQFSQASYAVNENLAKAVLTVKRTGDALGTVTVPYATSDGGTCPPGGTAVAGTDYTARSGVLTFLQGQASQMISVPLKNDKIVKGTVCFTTTLSPPTWTPGGALSGTAVLGLLSAATVNVLDTDNPVVKFSVAGVTVNEATKSTLISVMRAGSPAGTATVEWSVTGGTAVNGVDYLASPSGTLTFTPPQTVKTIPVTLNTTTVADGTRTVLFALQSPTGASLGTPATTVLTITPKEFAGVAQFSQANWNATESDNSVVVTVTRTGGGGSNATVAYETADLDPGTTATAGTDYTSTSGTLTFGLNATSQTFTIPILNDGVANPGVKTVVLKLGATGGGLTLGTREEATLWIVKE